MKWLVIAFLILPSSVSADDNIQKAQQLLNRMKYSKALEIADQALESPGSRPDDLVEAYRIKGLCLAAMGNHDGAVAVFGRLLAINPSYELSPTTSPKLATPFYQAASMAKAKRQKPITLVHRPPEPPKGVGAPGRIELKVELAADPFGMVKKIRLRFKVGGGNEWKLGRPVQGPGSVSFRLPPRVKAAEITYCFEALNEHGGLLALAGDKSNPFILSVKQDSEEVAGVPASIIFAHRPPKIEPDQSMNGLELKVTLEVDPQGKVAWARLRYKTDENPEERKMTAGIQRGGTVTFKLPENLRAQKLTYYIEATGSDGRVLASAGTEGRPYRLPPDRKLSGTEATEEPFRLRLVEREADRDAGERPYHKWGHVSFWTGVGLLGLGGVATWQAKEAGDQYSRSYGEDVAAGDRSKAWAGVMYAGYAAGAVLVAAGAVLWLLSPDDGRPGDRLGATIGLVPLDRGVIFTIGEGW